MNFSKSLTFKFQLKGQINFPPCISSSLVKSLIKNRVFFYLLQNIIHINNSLPPFIYPSSRPQYVNEIFVTTVLQNISFPFFCAGAKSRNRKIHSSSFFHSFFILRFPPSRIRSSFIHSTYQKTSVHRHSIISLTLYNPNHSLVCSHAHSFTRSPKYTHSN